MTHPPKPAPIFLLAGRMGPDREKSDAMMERIMSSAGVADPCVAYVGAANGDNRDFFLRMSDFLQSYGAREVTHAPLAGRRTDLEKTRAILESSDIVFMSGGDVEEGMEIVTERGILPFLRGLYDAGKPFFGLSAGSIMLAREWVRWDDPDDDATAQAFPCMGLAPIRCDVHAEDDDWEELHALLSLCPPGTPGYGIASGGGLCVYPDGTVEALLGPAMRFRKTDKTVVLESKIHPGVA